jgi:hypothetical protein
MTEPISAQIWVGGPIPRRLVPELCKTIGDEGVSLEWDDTCFQPECEEELVAALEDADGVRLLYLCDNQADYGEFDQLEKFCLREQMTFRRQSDSKIEFDAELVENRPGIGRVRYPTDACGRPFMPLATMAEVAGEVDKATETADGQTALELLRRLRNIQQLMHEKMPVVMPPLTPFEIVN